MSKKIFIGVVSVSLVIMLICAGLISGILYDYMGVKLDEQLADEAVLVEEGWLVGGEDYLSSLEERTDVGSRITLLSNEGEVLYDSAYDTHKMENHMQRDEVKEALAAGEGFATRISYTLAQDMRYYAKLTEDGNIIRISMSHNSRMRLLLDTSTTMIFVLAVLLLLGAAISYKIAKAIVKPINDINLDKPDIAASYDELKPLLHRISVQNESIRRQMEKLRKSREEFKIITENMNEGLLIIDKDAEILTCNSGALKMLAVPQTFGQAAVQTKTTASASAQAPMNSSVQHGQQTGKAAAVEGSVLKLNRSKPFRKAVSEALAGQSSQAYIEGKGFTCEVIASPVRNGREVSGAVLVLMDVTEREKGERMRREFTSNVSHELKTPLTSIYGVADMLAAGLVKAEDVKEFATSIKTESARLITLIDDILRLSQLDESAEMQENAAIDLWKITRAVAERLESKADENGVELCISYDGKIGESKIKGDSYIADEIVYNLCENAIKYNRRGGRVDMSVRLEAEKCVLTVADTGIGIPAEDKERVFERFFRVDKSHSKKIGGTGLGLSIVKHAVGHLGGTILLESEENVGTTVTVAFRRAAE